MTSPRIVRKRAGAQGGLDRRRFLAHAAALSAIPLLGERVEGRTVRGFRFVADPFSLGKANHQDRLLSDNPFVRFHNGQRGYVRCTITRRVWRSDYQVVEQVSQPGAVAMTKASFVIEEGKPGTKFG